MGIRSWLRAFRLEASRVKGVSLTVESLEYRWVPAGIDPDFGTLSSSLLDHHPGPTPNAQVAFVGDSILFNYQHADGGLAWNAAIEPFAPKNLAVGGYQTWQVLNQLQAGSLVDAAPHTIVLSVGVNDLAAGRTPEQVAGGVWSVVESLRATEPQASVLVHSLLPTRGLPDPAINAKIDQTNWWLSGLDDGSRVHYLPLNSAFRLADGTANPDLLSDGVHPNLPGYQLITSSLVPMLTELAPGPAPSAPAIAVDPALHARVQGSDGQEGAGLLVPNSAAVPQQSAPREGKPGPALALALLDSAPVARIEGDVQPDGGTQWGPQTGLRDLSPAVSLAALDASFAIALAGWQPDSNNEGEDGEDVRSGVKTGTSIRFDSVIPGWLVAIENGNEGVENSGVSNAGVA